MTSKALNTLLHKAAEQVQTAQEVLVAMAQQNDDLRRQVGAMGLTIKLASAGQIPLHDLAEKVAEFQEKTAEELELEAKVAERSTPPGHSLGIGANYAASQTMTSLGILA